MSPNSSSAADPAFKATVEQRIRPLQIIHLALGMGVAAFGVVLGVLSQQPHPAGNADAVATCTAISWVAAAITPTCWVVGIVLFRMRTAPAPLRAAFAESGPAGALGLYFSASILRISLCEGPALFGLVGLTLAITGGVLPDHAVYLADALPALAFFGAVAAFLPRPQQVYGLLAERIELE